MEQFAREIWREGEIYHESTKYVVAYFVKNVEVIIFKKNLCESSLVGGEVLMLCTLHGWVGSGILEVYFYASHDVKYWRQADALSMNCYRSFSSEVRT